MGGEFKSMSYTTKPYFEDVIDVGDLYIKYMLLYVRIPLVLICRDTKENLYYCTLVSGINEERWLLAPTSVDRIKSMFNKEITIHDMLSTAEGTGIIISYKGALKIQRSMPCGRFPDEDLPRQGFYWHSNEGDLIHCLDALAE